MAEMTKENAQAGQLESLSNAKQDEYVKPAPQYGTRDEPLPPPEKPRKDGTKDKMPMITTPPGPDRRKVTM